jgi:hypothetical protein
VIASSVPRQCENTALSWPWRLAAIEKLNSSYCHPSNAKIAAYRVAVRAVAHSRLFLPRTRHIIATNFAFPPIPGETVANDNARLVVRDDLVFNV